MADSKSGQPDNSNSNETPLPGGDNSLAQISLERQLPERLRSPSASFSPGELLAGRFKVLRFIARGGMGEVYEAEDLELKERVALKTVRFEIAHRERAIERFKREIQLARKVTHPNVCRTFDVFRHVENGGDGELRETLFVSMELLGGETLDERIRRGDRFSTVEAAPIVEQMAAGLHSAHQVGVIHRDFKSTNVMLILSQQSPGGVRVVITDFGLAHASVSSAPSLTGSEDLVGTPAFMAPEQLDGGEITPATDIYALGVVIYEMLTGALPFTGDTALATALKRLSEPPPSPRALVPDLDSTWEQSVLRCLERAPIDRFSSTEELLKALRSDYVPPSTSSLRKRRILVVLTLLLFVIGTIISIVIWYYYWNVKPPVDGKRRPSVAVLGFENFSGQESLSGLGDELAENLGSQLDTDEIHYISPARVDEMKRNLGLQKLSDALKPEALRKIHEFLGCDYVVSGSFSAEGEPASQTIQWNIHVENTLDGESRGTVTKTLAKSDRFKVVSDAGRLVRGKLGVEVAPSEERSIAAAMPNSNEASRYYTEGLTKLANFDPLSAAKLLEQSVKLEPDFAPSHSALAEAWSVLGYDAKAQEEAKKAFDLSAGLSKVTAGLIEGRYYATTQQWDKAITKYSSLWNLFSDPEYALLLAKSQIAAGKANDALLTLKQLRGNNPPIGILAQIDLQEAEAQADLANFQEQLKYATAAAGEAQALGGKLLLARARIPQCLALINLGKPQEAKSVCDEAKYLNQAVGDQLGTARAVNAIANAYYAQGNTAQARPLYEEALQISRAIGDKLDEAGALTNLGNIRQAQGDLEGAKKTYQESINVARDREDKVGLALAEQDLAGVLFMHGDRANAKDLYERSMELAKEIDAKDTEARALNNLCMISLDAGELKQALKFCADSLQLRQESGEKAGIARSLVNVGDILLAQGDLIGAKQNYDQALKIQQDLQAKGDAAYSQLSLAKVAMQDGRSADARNLAESAATELSAENDKSDEAQARLVLAEAMLMSGNLADARTQFERASLLAEQAGDRDLKVSVAITGAKIDVQSGKIDQGLKILESARRDARSSGLVETEFEATLALGEAEIRGGKAAAGRSLLKTLAQNAKAKGFDLIATKATRNN